MRSEIGIGLHRRGIPPGEFGDPRSPNGKLARMFGKLARNFGKLAGWGSREFVFRAQLIINSHDVCGVRKWSVCIPPSHIAMH